MLKQSYPSKFEFIVKITEGSFQNIPCAVCRKSPLGIPYYWVYKNNFVEDHLFYYATVCSIECQVMLMLKEM